MYKFPIGFICGLNDAQLDLAADIGLNGVQLWMPDREGKAPRDMKGEKLALSRRMLSDRGLEVSALCGDVGSYEDASKNPARNDEFKRIVDIAAGFDTRVVTTHIGKVPAERNCATYDNMLAACREVGDYAAAAGVRFAVETGPETAESLCAFLDELSNPGAGVNLDPANLIMCSLDDPVKAVYTLRKYIVHTHAKDGRALRKIAPADFYHQFAEGGLEWAATCGCCEETPLGEGSVRWIPYLKALRETGYDGYLTIEREVKNGAEDIRMAVRFLRETMKSL